MALTGNLAPTNIARDLAAKAGSATKTLKRLARELRFDAERQVDIRAPIG